MFPSQGPLSRSGGAGGGSKELDTPSVLGRKRRMQALVWLRDQRSG